MIRTAVGILALVLAGTAAAQDAGRIKSFTGDVTVRKVGKTGHEQVTVGQGLRLGDMLFTDVDAEARITLGGGAEVLVKEITQILINESLVTADQLKVNLLMKTGQVQTSIPPKALTRADFSVTTPVGTASIRGSEQLIAHSAGIGTTVKLLSGVGASQSANGRSASMKGGDSAKASSSGGLAGPVDMAKAESSPDLLPPGRDSSEKSASAPAGRANDRTLGDPGYPASLSGTQSQSATPVRIRFQVETRP